MKYRAIRLCFFLCAFTAAAETQQDAVMQDYSDFLAINTLYAERQESVLVKQVISSKSGSGESHTTAYCLFHKNGQCVRIQGTHGMQYFFSSAQGYWLFTDKLKKPLKISGSYKIEEFEIQDILKLNFQEEYAVRESAGSVLLLERLSKKPAYTYIFFERVAPEVFELTFADTKKQPVRKLVYHYGMVSGTACFVTIDVYNLIFPQEAVRSWTTEWIKPAAIPASLFTHTQLPALSNKMQLLIE